MKKRLLACVLVLSLLLNLSVSAFASGVSDDYVFYSGDIVYSESIPDDIHVNPEDYIMNSEISSSSLGLTLSMGQIAALIAAGGGVIFASQYMDDLGRHFQTALNSAAAVIPNGTDILIQWMTNAVNGDIALASAPSWIAQTILTTTYNIVSGVSSLKASYYSNTGFAPTMTGAYCAAGTPLYVGNVSSSDSIKRSFITPNFNYVPFTFAWVNQSTLKYGISTHLLCVDSGYPTSYSDGSVTRAFNANDMTVYDSVSTSEGTRYWWRVTGSFGTLSSQEHYERFVNYCLPGTIPFAENGYNSPSKSFVTNYVKQYFGEGVSDVLGMPDGEDVAPDVLIGGLPELWVGQGLGADVITFPDIMIDGTGVIAPDAALEGDAAIDAAIESALDRLATGELAWDDYWIDISKTGTVPTAKVEDTTTGELVDKPIGSDGTLKDPVVVPDYSTDLNDYTLDLKGIFPFCIPFDIYNFLSCLAADPVAPSWDWKLVVPFTNGDYSINVDLSPFDSVAVVFRNFELLIFIVGLGIKTRDIIKG